MAGEEAGDGTAADDGCDTGIAIRNVAIYVADVAYEQVSLRAIRQSHRRKLVLREAQGGPVRGFDSRDRPFGAYFRLMVCF